MISYMFCIVELEAQTEWVGIALEIKNVGRYLIILYNVRTALGPIIPYRTCIKIHDIYIDIVVDNRDE